MGFLGCHGSGDGGERVFARRSIILVDGGCMLRSPLRMAPRRGRLSRDLCRYKAPMIMYTTSAIDTLDSHIDEPPVSAMAPLAPGTVWFTVMFFS